MHRTDKQKALNVFKGETAVIDFLNPDNAPYTPLIEIPKHLNPYHEKGVRVFAKLMNALPLANVKSLPALNMLLEAKKKGVLDNVDTVIENSSGNTVLSLAVIARLFGIKKTKAVVSHEVSAGKLKLLRFLGTEIIVNEEPICPDPKDKNSGIYKSKQWAQENNWFNPGQYDNADNPNAHYKWTGPQIWQQTQGAVTLLSVGLGTTGSAVGISKYLKEQSPDITIVGVSRAPNNPVPGVRTNNLLKEIAFDWSKNVDHQEEVGTHESFRLSLELCRAGILVGPSSGFALKGLYNYLEKQNFQNTKEKVAVCVCPDSPLPYINEYFDILKKEDFPQIQNEHLLQNKEDILPPQKKRGSENEEVDVDTAFGLLFNETKDEVWGALSKGQKVSLAKGVQVIDTRRAGEFEGHHIPSAIHVPYAEIDSYLKKNKRKLKKQKSVLFVCRYGSASRAAAY